ncbi:NAD(P)H-binding protein [Spirillospora sp. CA-294931]|uniref:NAD(P)H-binding protein n=1 Tax=Spirillospora sp. CA-294931 TaxID=3240042 RepID=UPI003D943255
MIVITGATGNVGRPLVELLASAGQKVRALTRDPASARLPSGVEAARTQDLPLDGATSLFLNPAVVWGGAEEMISKATDGGVRRIVLLSSAAALDDDPGNMLATRHRDLEKAIEDAGVEWVFTRPGEFDANALGWAEKLRAGEPVREPFPGSRSAPIHEKDIAAVAARALLDDDLVGTRPLLTGPETITHPDQVRMIGEAIGRPTRFEEITPEEAREEMLRLPYMRPGLVDVLLRLRAEAVDAPEEISPEVERITGRPPRAFAEWAADHADDFR